MPMVVLVPRFPTLTVTPLPPKLNELPRFPMFHRTPGAILKLFRNRHPMSSRPEPRLNRLYIVRIIAEFLVVAPRAVLA